MREPPLSNTIAPNYLQAHEDLNTERLNILSPFESTELTLIVVVEDLTVKTSFWDLRCHGVTTCFFAYAVHQQPAERLSYPAYTANQPLYPFALNVKLKPLSFLGAALDRLRCRGIGRRFRIFQRNTRSRRMERRKKDGLEANILNWHEETIWLLGIDTPNCGWIEAVSKKLQLNAGWISRCRYLKGTETDMFVHVHSSRRHPHGLLFSNLAGLFSERISAMLVP